MRKLVLIAIYYIFSLQGAMVVLYLNLASYADKPSACILAYMRAHK
jgi:hypothetical protein